MIFWILGGPAEKIGLSKENPDDPENQSAFLAMERAFIYILRETEFQQDTPSSIIEKILRFRHIYRVSMHASSLMHRRESGHSEFTHFYDTARILLEEFGDAVSEEVYLALTHDLIENWSKFSYKADATPEIWLSREIGDTLYGKVKALSKKEVLEIFKTFFPEEFIIFDGAETVHARNYFKNCNWHARLKEVQRTEYFTRIKTLDRQLLRVKFADRLSNLRTLDVFPRDKIKEKCQETMEHLFESAQKTCPMA